MLRVGISCNFCRCSLNSLRIAGLNFGLGFELTLETIAGMPHIVQGSHNGNEGNLPAGNWPMFGKESDLLQHCIMIIMFTFVQG